MRKDLAKIASDVIADLGSALEKYASDNAALVAQNKEIRAAATNFEKKAAVLDKLSSKLANGDIATTDEVIGLLYEEGTDFMKSASIHSDTFGAGTFEGYGGNRRDKAAFALKSTLTL